jgi:hypothetical protein
MAFQNNHSGLKRRVMIFIFLAMMTAFKNFGQEPAVMREGSETGKGNQATRIDDNPERDKWIQKIVQELRELIKTGLDTQMVKPHITEYEDIREVSYRVVDRGNIRCENGEIIRIVLHSSHTNKEIGDISVAVDTQLRVFVNKGHVCGGIVHFETKDDILPADADDFFHASFRIQMMSGGKYI